jgi:hypothetical protein
MHDEKRNDHRLAGRRLFLEDASRTKYQQPRSLQRLDYPAKPVYHSSTA